MDSSTPIDPFGASRAALTDPALRDLQFRAAWWNLVAMVPPAAAIAGQAGGVFTLLALLWWLGLGYLVARTHLHALAHAVGRPRTELSVGAYLATCLAATIVAVVCGGLLTGVVVLLRWVFWELLWEAMIDPELLALALVAPAAVLALAMVDAVWGRALLGLAEGRDGWFVGALRHGFGVALAPFRAELPFALVGLTAVAAVLGLAYLVLEPYYAAEWIAIGLVLWLLRSHLQIAFMVHVGRVYGNAVEVQVPVEVADQQPSTGVTEASVSSQSQPAEG